MFVLCCSVFQVFVAVLVSSRGCGFIFFLPLKCMQGRNDFERECFRGEAITKNVLEEKKFILNGLKYL